MGSDNSSNSFPPENALVYVCFAIQRLTDTLFIGVCVSLPIWIGEGYTCWTLKYWVNRPKLYSSLLTYINNHVTKTNLCPQLLHTLIVFVFPDIVIYVHFICAIFLETANGLKACLLLSLEAAPVLEIMLSHRDGSVSTVVPWEMMKLFLPL